MKQDEGEIEKGVTMYKDVAANASPWFVKLAGYQLLNATKNHYMKLAKEEEKMLNSEENAGNTSKISEIENKISAYNAKAKELGNEINSIKSKETDAQVLQYLKQIIGE